jgi:hypothetical protein
MTADIDAIISLRPLTGVGVQDTAIAFFGLEQALR